VVLGTGERRWLGECKVDEDEEVERLWCRAWFGVGEGVLADVGDAMRRPAVVRWRWMGERWEPQSSSTTWLFCYQLIYDNCQKSSSTAEAHCTTD